MVLQRNQPLQLWGWAGKGEKVSLRFNGKSYQATGGSDGKWMFRMPAQAAGGPYTMTLTATNKIVLKDILIGDVWLCAGQSNMVHQLELHKETYASDIAKANYPTIRQFWIPTGTSLQGPKQDLPTGFWKAADPESARQFSAVAFFFALATQQHQQVPIGLINASVGGTPAEAWTSEEGLKEFASLQQTIQQLKDTGYVNKTNRDATARRNIIQQNMPADKGMTERIKWFEKTYQPKGWRPISIPGYWEDQGIRNLDGIVWYRKEIELPANLDNSEGKLYLGRIVDADAVYINGSLVGSTSYQYPQRRYGIAAGILKKGMNTIVIRVTNQQGKGGFVPDKPYYLNAGNERIDLQGSWKYKVGAIFEPQEPGGGISFQNQPTALYNAMIAPLVPFALKGILWYQGESNAGDPGAYAKLLPALIRDWRNVFAQKDLPFLFVQLPNFMEASYRPEESNWALMREAQASALSEPHTAMAVAIDLGEWNDIHPDNKKDVGLRLALAAEKEVYGRKVVASGPLLQSAKVNGNAITITFKETGSGLVTNDGEAPGGFAIAGADKKFVWANARLESNTVVVWNDKIAQPLYVRYAWADNPVQANLYNREGLPAAPFRTDNLPADLPE